MGDMRDEINAAFDSAESEADEPIEASAPEETIEPSSEEEPVPGVDTETETEPVKETTLETPEIGGMAATGAEDSPTGEDNTAIKAPAGWTPQQREEWSKVPPQIQKHINDRETEIAAQMANTSSARQTHDRMEKLGQSFAPILAAEGVSDPVQAAQNLFSTVAQLRMGTPQQKAETVAGLISHYGIDIGTLDNALVGNQTEQPNAEMERMLDQRMAPVNQLMQQLQQVEQRNHQATRQQADNTVREFAKTAEFLDDLRGPTADIIDAAAERGQQMGLEQAYKIACQVDPQVSQIIKQREAQEALTGRTASLQGKSLAASSLNGRRGGSPSPGGPMSLRDQLNSAWDEANGG